MKALTGTVRHVTAASFTVLVVLILVLALPCAGCGDKEITIEGDSDEKAISKSLEAEVGEELVVSLESNPSTGYSWRFTEPLDEKVIKLEKTQFQEGDMKPGAPGTQVWWFKTVGEGRATISMEYVRSWEENEEPERTFTADVTVKGKGDTEAMEYSDPNSPIDVAVDTAFYIVLDSNPTTGYQWELSEPVDDDVLRLEGSRYEPQGDTSVMGAGGKEYWEFHSVGSGSTNVSFRYVRSWETDIEPESTAAFTVNVK